MIERYTHPEMGHIWTLENEFRTMLQVEILACEAMNKLGIVPDDALKDIQTKADFRIERIKEIEAVTNHDIIAFLTNVAEYVGDASKYIHKGLTSSDVKDTALGVMMKQSADLLLSHLEKFHAVLKRRAAEHKHTIMIGRTHGIHAEPMTFGLKFALWMDETERNIERLKQARDFIAVGKLSGAVGTYSNIDPFIEEYVCEKLGIKAARLAPQVIQRDRHAAYFTALAVTAGTIERLCVELRHLQRTEVREVEEGFGKGQKGSSAMPHKKNPISAENMTGLSRLIRTNALAALENQALWHERDISHSSVERVIMPDSTILTDYVLHRLCRLLEGLRIMPENMARNMECSFGLYFSQRVLTALIETGIPRQEAYVMVQRTAMRGGEPRQPFPELIKADPEINSRLSEETFAGLFDPQFYLRHEGDILKRVFEE